MDIPTLQAPAPNDLVLLDPEKVRLLKDRPGWLALSMDGEEVRVKPARNFPLTDPENYISLLNEDETEIGVIEDPSLLEQESRETLARMLEETYFLPTIQRVLLIKEDFGVFRWDVMTDKGPRSFEVRGRDDVRFVTQGHILVRDIDGNRYHILNMNRLDPESRAHIDLLL